MQPPGPADTVFPGRDYIPSDPGSPLDHRGGDISEKLHTLAYLLSLALSEQDSKANLIHKELVALKGLETRSLVSAKNIYTEYKKEYDKLPKHGIAESLRSQMGTTLMSLGKYLMFERDVSTLSNAMYIILDEQLADFVTREGDFLDSLSNLDQMSGMPSVALINAARRLSGENIVDTTLWEKYGHVYSELRALITDPQETMKRLSGRGARLRTIKFPIPKQTTTLQTPCADSQRKLSASPHSTFGSLKRHVDEVQERRGRTKFRKVHNHQRCCSVSASPPPRSHGCDGSGSQPVNCFRQHSLPLDTHKPRVSAPSSVAP